MRYKLNMVVFKELAINKKYSLLDTTLYIIENKQIREINPYALSKNYLLVDNPLSIGEWDCDYSNADTLVKMFFDNWQDADNYLDFITTSYPTEIALNYLRQGLLLKKEKKNV